MSISQESKTPTVRHLPQMNSSIIIIIIAIVVWISEKANALANSGENSFQ